MASSVQIELIVDEKGAVQGVRAFDASVKSTTNTVRSLNAEMAKAGAGSGMKQFEREVTAGEGSIRTMNAELRSLQGTLFGDTRAAAEFLASIKGVGAAMEVAFPVFGIAALAGVLVDAGRKAHELYEKFFSLTQEAQDYNAEIQKAKEADFGNTRSIEETIARIREATEEVEKYKQAQVDTGEKMKALNLMPGGWLLTSFIGKQLQHAQLEAQRQVDKLNEEKFPEQHHQAILDQIKLSYAPAPGESRATQVARRRNEQIAENAENQKYLAAMSGVKGNNPVTDAGLAHERVQDAIARRDAEVELFDLQKENAAELRRIREEALESTLRGEDLYRQKETFAIDEMTRKLQEQGDTRQQIDEAIAKTREKFDAEEMKRLEQQAQEIQKMGRGAMGSGLTGIAKLQFEGQSKIQGIRGDTTHSDAWKAMAMAAANTETNAAILTSEQSFTDKVDQLAASSADHQVQGFARIRAEGQREIEALRKDYEKLYGSDTSNPAYQAHLGDLNRGIGAIRGSTQDQQAELVRRNSAETEEIEDQARSRFLSAEKNKTAAIEAEYQQRLAKLKEELASENISYDDYTKRVEAAGMDMQAELVEQAQQARQKIASELSGLIGAHPLEGLQRMGEKAASQAGGAVLARLAGHYGARVPGAQGGSVWDRIAGVPHSTIDQHAELPGMHGAGAGAGIFSIGSATIHVGAASIVGGGGGGSRGGYGGGMSLSPAVYGGGGSSIGAGYSDIGVSPSFAGAGAGGGVSFAGGTPVGAAPAQGAGFAGIASNVVSGASTANSLISMMKKPAGLQTSQPPGFKINDDGSVSTLAGGKDSAMSHTLGVAGAGLGLFSAYKTGGMGGMMGGAMSGAQMGLELGGPMGAAVGAIAGAALGFFGGGEQARVWWLKQGRPRLSNDMDAFQQGGMDYLSAYMDIEQLKTEAHQTLSKMGFVGSRYYHDTVTGEITQAENKLSREQRAGRSASTFSAAQFASGTDSVPRDGAAWIHAKERIIPSDQNERITRSLEGAHALYRSALQPSSASRTSMAPDTRPHLHIHAIDAKSFVDMLSDNSDGVRDAYNASFARYGGMAGVPA